MCGPLQVVHQSKYVFFSMFIEILVQCKHDKVEYFSEDYVFLNYYLNMPLDLKTSKGLFLSFVYFALPEPETFTQNRD